MLQGLKTYLLFGNQYTGIEHTSVNGKQTLYATLLKKKKKEADVESVFEAESIKELSNKIPKSLGCFLIINDTNVITKKVETNHKDPVKVVNMAFPNLNLSDFVYELILQEESHFVSICRKDYIESLIENYETNGISIISTSLANALITNVLGFINGDIIHTATSIIKKDEQNIISIEPYIDTEKLLYNINGIEVSNKHLLSFSAALSTLLQVPQPTSNFESQKQLLFENYSQSKLFKQSIKIGLAIIFALLLINFGVFSHYFNKVEMLQQTSQVNQEAKIRILELDKKVSKSQKTVETMLSSSTSKTAYYLNDIIQTLPTSIQLSEVNYQPLNKRLKTSEPISNTKNTMVISGESGNSELFAYWIADLESKEWIEKVETLDYSDISSNISNFSIKLNLQND
uniref:hypothetical protein n=1 Tax=Gelidibacter sp. TaxID=2018083 RepID=UPI00404AFAF2